MCKPPPLAVRLEKALPLRRVVDNLLRGGIAPRCFGELTLSSAGCAPSGDGAHAVANANTSLRLQMILIVVKKSS